MAISNCLFSPRVQKSLNYLISNRLGLFFMFLHGKISKILPKTLTPHYNFWRRFLALSYAGF